MIGPESNYVLDIYIIITGTIVVWNFLLLLTMRLDRKQPWMGNRVINLIAEKCNTETKLKNAERRIAKLDAVILDHKMSTIRYCAKYPAVVTHNRELYDLLKRIKEE